ncbi:MAG: glycosyltransferase family 1 protein, partial [Clostridiaceae bacterium]|nr:glycosyltransferase family 1 protein [Clostridiaceae bacterium]
GQETFIMNVFRNIDRDKICFNFLCSTQGEGEFDQEIRNLGGSLYVLPPVKRQRGVLKYIEQIHAISGWLKENRNVFDVVHVHTYHSLSAWVHLEACRRAKVSKVIIHSHNTSGPHQMIHRLLREVCKLYRYDKFACSHDAAIWMFGKHATKAGHVHMFYNGIDVSAFRYDEGIARAYKEELQLFGRPVVGHIGRFGYQKNHKFLIEVFKEYLKHEPTAILLLVGKGELEEDIRRLVKEYSMEDSVRFLGSRNDIPQLLNAMDAFVFPSHFEGLSVVLVEAQCNGISIIANENIGKETIISDAMHLLKLESGAKAWANQLSRIIGKRTKSIKTDDFLIANITKEIAARYLTFFRGK